MDLNHVRGFGPFIAVIENTVRDPETAKALSKEVKTVTGPRPQSAGRSELRTERTRLGPNLAESFELARAAYPGRLHIYNVATEKLFTITTNQADSEILLIEDGAVYYRVSDRLYKASISDQGIGSAELLATDERIRDAHWAFIKH
jgi:hypothetical protein